VAKTITLQLDDDTYNTLQLAAKGDRRTVPNFIEHATISYIFDNNIVDDEEMEEILMAESDLQQGLDDMKNKRYKIVE
jgi:predicted transcriptional regulator